MLSPGMILCLSLLGVSFPSFLLLIFFFHFYHSVLILGLLYCCLLVYCSNLLSSLITMKIEHIFSFMNSYDLLCELSFYDMINYFIICFQKFLVIWSFTIQNTYSLFLYFFSLNIVTFCSFYVLVGKHFTRLLMTEAGNIKINRTHLSLLVYVCSVASVVSNSLIPWTGAQQAPLSVGFSQQEH